MMFNIKTPAKINTFLNIDSVREDGYHNISSHMQLIDLFDEISFVPSNSNAIFCEYSELQEQNLIIKSIEYFNENFSTNFNFQINLKKNIPFASGLGGGSSNAAYTILLLCMLSGISTKKLNAKEVGKEIGADVPFFINSKSCYVAGFGEKLKESFSKNIEFLLISPKINVSTSQIFQSKHLKIDKLRDCEKNSLLEPLLMENHEFNRFYVRLLDKSSNLQNRLKLSGSGSSLFIESPTFEEKQILQPKNRDNFRIFCLKGLEYYDFKKDWGVAKW
jgi:4-diphosphocytidyl-2-C-methyl-D-erythritol kinase